MLKPLIAATAVLAIGGSTLVYAQQSFGEHHGFGHHGQRAEHRKVSPQDRAAYTDARIAALKAGLELTSDQAKNWPAFEQALRDVAQLRLQRMEARQARGHQSGAPQQGQTPANPFDRLNTRADTMTKTSAALKKLAEFGAPLYQSLTDDQKTRFTALSRMLRPHHRMVAFNEHNGGWRQGGGQFGPGQGSGHGHHHGAPNGGGNDGDGVEALIVSNCAGVR